MVPAIRSRIVFDNVSFAYGDKPALKDAPILLLDEATASLDPDNECEVRSALATACKGKTVVIAHHPNTIVSADRIVVFADGHVVDTTSGFADLSSIHDATDRTADGQRA